jgi:hypothetical protein
MPPCATVWIAPPVRSPVADLLADLGRAFDALGIPWYLFGAQAAIVYGVARLTADVDVTARVPQHGVGWLDTIETHGFERRFTDARVALQARVIPVVHRATGLPVDIVLAGPGLEEQLLERAVTQDIDGVAVPVIEVSDLVVLKVLAARPKDIEDVATLLHTQGGRIDEARVRAVLGDLEAALGQSDLLARATARQFALRVT